MVPAESLPKKSMQGFISPLLPINWGGEKKGKEKKYGFKAFSISSYSLKRSLIDIKVVLGFLVLAGKKIQAYNCWFSVFQNIKSIR